MSETVEQTGMRDDWGSLSPDFVQGVRDALAGSSPDSVRETVRDLHAADLADLIEALEPGERVALISTLGRGFDVEALAELDEAVRDQLMEALPAEVIASAIKKLDTDDALYLIEDLAKEDQDEILEKVGKEDRAALDRGLDYEDGTAGRLMQTEFVAAPSFWTVENALAHLRSERDLPEDFVEIYIVDPSFHPQGAVALSRLVRSAPATKLTDILEEDFVVFAVGDQQEDVAFKFEQYNLVSAAVVDADMRLVGVLTIDDIVDVIQEESEQDILHLGGVGAEEAVTDTVWKTTRSRFSWLFLNLLTAVLASWVISWFDATINQMVALAVLMPIVASMGGNAGTQTMTVAVRALATRNLGPMNAFRVTMRETAVGLINGVIFALIIGLFAYWWFGLDRLGLVIGAAMVINLIAAALAGILVPLALDGLDVDPAVSSGVFVTTVTDVIGFFAFLGLAALWLVGTVP